MPRPAAAAAAAVLRPRRPTALSKVELERRRLAVCGTYPGGPSGYTYTPERCTRRAVAPVKRVLSVAKERAALVAALTDPRNMPTPPSPPTKANEQGALGLTRKGLVLRTTIATVLLRQQQQMPAFIKFALDVFRKKLRAAYPDPNERYARVCEVWEADVAPRDEAGMPMGDFSGNHDARWAVMSIALASLA